MFLHLTTRWLRFSRGILLVDYLPKCLTINGQYYANLLRQLCENTKAKRRGKTHLCANLLLPWLQCRQISTFSQSWRKNCFMQLTMASFSVWMTFYTTRRTPPTPVGSRDSINTVHQRLRTVQLSLPQSENILNTLVRSCVLLYILIWNIYPLWNPNRHALTV